MKINYNTIKYYDTLKQILQQTKLIIKRSKLLPNVLNQVLL